MTEDYINECLTSGRYLDWFWYPSGGKKRPKGYTRAGILTTKPKQNRHERRKAAAEKRKGKSS